MSVESYRVTFYVDKTEYDGYFREVKHTLPVKDQDEGMVLCQLLILLVGKKPSKVCGLDFTSDPALASIYEWMLADISRIAGNDSISYMQVKLEHHSVTELFVG